MVGEPCDLVGGTHGTCVLDSLCTDDDPETAVNECLLCVDGCWGSEPGAACSQLTGAPGVCQMQDRCTDREETSFVECNRCVPDEGGGGEDGGCQAIDAATGLPWVLILIGLGVQRRRLKINA